MTQGCYQTKSNNIPAYSLIRAIMQTVNIFLHLSPTAGVGNLRPAGRIRPDKQIHLARSPFANCWNCMAHLVVLRFINLPFYKYMPLHSCDLLLYDKTHFIGGNNSPCRTSLLYALINVFVISQSRLVNANNSISLF